MQVYLKELNPQFTTVSGRQYSIEDRETGQVFVTNKKYIDKLFDRMGYRNLNVIKILEDFVGKVITDVGSLRDCSIYADEETSSFVVASSDSVEFLSKLYSYLEDNGYETVEYRRYDDYTYWDQMIVKSPSGTYFAFYINLASETITILTLDYNEKDKVLYGVVNEGEYQMGSDMSVLESIKVLISNPINISPDFYLGQSLSMRELSDLLINLGLVKKKKDKYYLTDNGEDAQTYAGNLSDFIDDLNDKSWLQRCITKSGFTLRDVCETFLKYNLDHVQIWSIKWIFEDNAKEKSDMYALNY